MATSPTIKDVARLSGVSYKTVSRVINGEAAVSAATRARVTAAVAASGYRPHAGARGLRLGRAYALRLLMKTGTARFLLNPFQDEVVGGVVDTAAARGYAIMIDLAGRPRPDLPGSAAATSGAWLAEGRVDGTVLLDSEAPSVLAAELARAGAPAVVIANRDLDPRLSWVDVDFFGGAVLVAEHLLALGHRHFAYLTDNPAFRSTTERERGFHAALAAAGLAVDPALFLRAGQLRHEGDQATARLLATGRPFTAVVCVNDLSALGAIDCLLRHGRRVPADISVTGYDDIALSQWTVPPLTTAHIPWYASGATATTLLLDQIEGQQTTPEGRTLPVTLTVRGTTGPAAQADAALP